jgi:hypothetical protein
VTAVILTFPARPRVLASLDAELAETESALNLARGRRDALPAGDRRWLRAHVEVVRLVESWSVLTARRNRIVQVGAAVGESE